MMKHFDFIDHYQPLRMKIMSEQNCFHSLYNINHIDNVILQFHHFIVIYNKCDLLARLKG